MTVIEFPQRKAIGDAHEAEVRRELERRGWTVDPYGQDRLSEMTKRRLSRTKSRFRWDPDFFVADSRRLRIVDAKTKMPTRAGETWSVSRESAFASLDIWRQYEIPFYYVFGNMTIATPLRVLSVIDADRYEDVPAWVPFPANLARPMDDVFGEPQWWAEKAA